MLRLNEESRLPLPLEARRAQPGSRGPRQAGLLLCLLVLLVPVDDAQARATPGPDDDAWAAENNDFLIPQATEVAPAQDRAPAPGAGWVPDDFAVPAPSTLFRRPLLSVLPAVRVPDNFAVPSLVAVPAPSALFRRPLLYLLLSLRR
jgi:hypothetical protein